jgi:hypothetical protein
VKPPTPVVAPIPTPVPVPAPASVPVPVPPPVAKKPRISLKKDTKPISVKPAKKVAEKEMAGTSAFVPMEEPEMKSTSVLVSAKKPRVVKPPAVKPPITVMNDGEDLISFDSVPTGFGLRNNTMSDLFPPTYIETQRNAPVRFEVSEPDDGITLSVNNFAPIPSSPFESIAQRETLVSQSNELVPYERKQVADEYLETSHHSNVPAYVETQLDPYRADVQAQQDVEEYYTPGVIGVGLSDFDIFNRPRVNFSNVIRVQDIPELNQLQRAGQMLAIEDVQTVPAETDKVVSQDTEAEGTIELPAFSSNEQGGFEKPKRGRPPKRPEEIGLSEEEKRILRNQRRREKARQDKAHKDYMEYLAKKDAPELIEASKSQEAFVPFEGTAAKLVANIENKLKPKEAQGSGGFENLYESQLTNMNNSNNNMVKLPLDTFAGFSGSTTRDIYESEPELSSGEPPLNIVEFE